MGFIVICIVLFFGLKLYPSYQKYRLSDYKNASGNRFFKTVFDKGNYGEFLTFVELERFSGYHRLMTNLYIPKADGSTTEIDLIMISPAGILVFESKNYSGWVFGDEKHKYWTQTLHKNSKNKFYNPIWQNKGHISALKALPSLENDKMYRSYIVFSERCVLKEVNYSSEYLNVIRRNNLFDAVYSDILNSERLLNIEQIDEIFYQLEKYTLVDNRVKEEHVNQIKNANNYESN
ncbi:MAG: NERD domain-containing protein [Clostridium sp.]|nr:NERD domain-containing protein [Clostridium sp.]